jgi:hypothetical protein
MRTTPSSAAAPEADEAAGDRRACGIDQPAQADRDAIDVVDRRDDRDRRSR